MELNINIQRLHILLVEDSSGDIRLFTEYLKEIDSVAINLDVVNNLRSVKELSHETFDVIITDLSLPDTQGVGTYHNIQAIFPLIPIIVLSGDTEKQIAIRSVQAGAQDYLLKGHVEPHMLLSRIVFAMERKKIEQKLIDLTQLKTDFVSTVSHELRTPLAVIQEGLSILSEGLYGELNADQGQIVDMAIANAQRLTRLVSDLLDISKIEANKLDLHLEAYDLVQVTSFVIQQFDHSASKMNISLILGNKAGQPLIVRADHDKLVQIITNLLSNAVKYSPAYTNINIDAEKDGKCARLTVSDCGSGISPEHLPKIFDKFSRLPNKANPQVKGVGLGLAITKALVIMHGGTIEVKSLLGVGSSFTITIPLESP